MFMFIYSSKHVPVSTVQCSVSKRYVELHVQYQDMTVRVPVASQLLQYVSAVHIHQSDCSGHLVVGTLGFIPS